MTSREAFAWILVGFLLGLVVAAYLFGTPAPHPEPPKPCADAQPIDDLHNADFRSERAG
jgi:hypothetical protein